MLNLATTRNNWDVFSVLDDFMPGSVERVRTTQEVAPRADVVETTEEIVVRMEMPGISAQDIDIQLDKDVLSIKAEKKVVQNDIVYHRSEIRYGLLKRAFTLPAHVQRDKIDAAYVDGVLTIHLPKAEESKPKAIPVKTS